MMTLNHAPVQNNDTQTSTDSGRYPNVHTRVPATHQHAHREFFIDNLLVRIHFIIVMIRWTGLAPWEFEFPFPGSRTSMGSAHTPARTGGISELTDYPKVDALGPWFKSVNFKGRRHYSVLNLRILNSQKFAAVPRRARIEGS